MPSPDKQFIAVLERDYFTTVNSAAFFQLIRDRLSARRLTIHVQGCNTDGQPRGLRVQLPDADKSLLNLIPDGFLHYMVTVNYTGSEMLPSHKLTRAEWVIEILDIFEGLRSNINILTKEKLAEIDLVMEYIRNTYSVDELADLSYMKTMRLEA